MKSFYNLTWTSSSFSHFFSLPSSSIFLFFYHQLQRHTCQGYLHFFTWLFTNSSKKGKFTLSYNYQPVSPAEDIAVSQATAQDNINDHVTLVRNSNLGTGIGHFLTSKFEVRVYYPLSTHFCRFTTAWSIHFMVIQETKDVDVKLKSVS